MIDIFERGVSERNTNWLGASRAPSPSQQLAAADWKPQLPKPAVTGAPFVAPVAAGSPLIALLGQQFAPIATPVVFGGISQEALALFAPQLQANGLLPVSGVGGAAPITPLAQSTEKTLAPGTSVSVQLVRGDYSIAASGTVTLRDGERIYAFGHPFLSLGSSDMPMTESFGRDRHPEHEQLFQALRARPDGRHHLAGSRDAASTANSAKRRR